MGTSPSGGIMPPAPDYLAPRRIYGPSKAKRRKQVNPTGPKIRRAPSAPAADLGDRDAPNTNDPHVSMT